MNQSTTEFLRTDFGHEVYDEWYLGPGSYNFESPEFVESHFRFYEQALMLSNQNVTFVTSAFEEWDSDQKFNLIISATAFHWVDPTVRYLKAYQALRSNCFLAVFSNQHIRKEDGFFREVQDLYDTYYIPLPSDQTSRPPKSSGILEPGLEAFHNPIRRVYPWQEEYSSEEYIKLLSTYSDHIALPENNRLQLFNGIVSLIETKYNGQVVKYYEAVLNLRKTK